MEWGPEPSWPEERSIYDSITQRWTYNPDDEPEDAIGPSVEPSPEKGPKQSRPRREHRRWPYAVGAVVVVMVLIAGPLSPIFNSLIDTAVQEPEGPDLSAPGLVYPYDGYRSYVDSANVMWSPLNTSRLPTEYELLIGLDEVMCIIMFNVTVEGFVYELSSIDDGTYYWCVRAGDGEVWGNWSEVWSFTVRTHINSPVPLSPTGTGTVTDLSPEFTWESVDGATEYYLQVSIDDSFDTAVVNEIVENATAYDTVQILPENMTYYWRVMAIDQVLMSEWSPVSSFYMGFIIFQSEFEWVYGVQTYTLPVVFDGAHYYEYKDRARTFPSSQYASYVTSDDDAVMSIAFALVERASAKGLSTFETAQFILNFVQAIEYGYDEVTEGMIEYPRYPVEMLVDEIGDCEDSSILYASLMEAMGYDCVLLLFPGDHTNSGHVAVGLSCDTTMPSQLISYDGKEYRYCETTGYGWIIGIIPQDMIGRSYTVIPC